jgi:hypothetical protein
MGPHLNSLWNVNGIISHKGTSRNYMKIHVYCLSPKPGNLYRILSCSCQESNPSHTACIAHCYTDWATQLKIKQGWMVCYSGSIRKIKLSQLNRCGYPSFVKKCHSWEALWRSSPKMSCHTPRKFYSIKNVSRIGFLHCNKNVMMTFVAPSYYLHRIISFSQSTSLVTTHHATSSTIKVPFILFLPP